MLIRAMEEKDVKRVHEIEVESFSEPWSYEGFYNTIGDRRYHFYCLEEAGEVIGYLGMVVVCGEADITNVAIASAHRAKGLGNEFIGRVLDAERLLGTSAFYLEVRKSNEAAIKAYKHNGFTITGERKNFYSKPVEDAYIMACTDRNMEEEC